MGVKQFNVLYSPVEDRMIFNFNNEEGQIYSFLFTRAIAKSFFDQSEIVLERANGIDHSERSSKIISEFQKEGLKKQLDFKDVFEGGQTFPLGKTPILTSLVQMELKEGAVRISLSLISNQVVGFGLPILQLQALVLLLEKLTLQAHWQIGSDIQVTATDGHTFTENTLTQLH
jgi:hypothetical protein